jgi:hypothetical protein
MNSIGKLLFQWLWDPAHFGDRRIQACVTVVFCMTMISVCYAHPSDDNAVTTRIIDWSYVTLLSVVGIYHAARGVDEVFGRTTTGARESAEDARAGTRRANAEPAREAHGG